MGNSKANKPFKVPNAFVERLKELREKDATPWACSLGGLWDRGAEHLNFHQFYRYKFHDFVRSKWKVIKPATKKRRHAAM